MSNADLSPGLEREIFLVRIVERQQQRIAALEAALREALEAFDGGHDAMCPAICGPDGETWIEESRCECWVKPARALLHDSQEEDESKGAQLHPPVLCGRCRHPYWSVQHYWRCGWRDGQYNEQGQPEGRE